MEISRTTTTSMEHFIICIKMKLGNIDWLSRYVWRQKKATSKDLADPVKRYNASSQLAVTSKVKAIL